MMVTEMGHFTGYGGITDGGGLIASGTCPTAVTRARVRTCPRSAVEWIHATTAEPLSAGVRAPIELNLTRIAEGSLIAVSTTRAFDDLSTVAARGVPPSHERPPLRSRAARANTGFRMAEDREPPAKKAKASSVQSLTRALDILDAVAERPMLLPELAERVGLSRPQCYKLASALAERGLIRSSPRRGYSLGTRIAELAAIEAKQSATKRPLARPI